ncbi:hypothetical protein HOA92_06855 [archaeon]|jgi:hypothetical protein|nr:hypothetical protein [archaeon]MBT6762732.1 hypothetical protein [archaeon]
MSLEKIVSRNKSMLPLLLTLPFISCQKPAIEEIKSVPHFEVTQKLTDSSGIAKFVDDQSGEDVTIYVKSETSSGPGVAGALVVFFDGDGSEAFYSEHPDYNTTDFQIYEHNSSHTLTLTSNTWQGWSVTRKKNESLQKSSRQFVDWVLHEKNNGWGYFGCSLFEDIKDERKLPSMLYAGASKTSPVAAINTVSETIQTILGIFVNDLELKEAEECVAFQRFGFIPNLDGWVSPSGGMVLNYCYTPASTETYTDNKIDDDCDGEIDEGGSSSGSGSGGGSDFECSGDEFFCDDFNDGDLSSDWNFESGYPTLSGGKMKFEEAAKATHGLYIDVTGEHEHSFRMLSEIVSGTGYDIQIKAEARVAESGGVEFYDGYVQIWNHEGKIWAECYDFVNNRYVEGDERTLNPGENYQLEIVDSQGHISVYINESTLLFSQDNCFEDFPINAGDLDLLTIEINNAYNDGPDFNYFSVDRF